MNLLDKIQLLGAVGKYDICASTASPRRPAGDDRLGRAAASSALHIR